jgi:hypothetical protein
VSEFIPDTDDGVVTDAEHLGDPAGRTTGCFFALVCNALTFPPSIKLATGKVQGASHDPRLLLREVGTDQLRTLVA